MALTLPEVKRYFEAQPTSIAIWVVVFDEKREKVLLVREKHQRKEGLVGLPGGKPKQNGLETSEEAGARELREETGFRVAPENLISYPNNVRLDNMMRLGEQKHYAGKALIATAVDGDLRAETPETRAFWARINRLDRFGKRLSPSVKPVVSEALRFLNTR